MLKLLQRLFGNKKEKDIKELQPYVGKILAEYNKLQKISDDDLRGRSDTFRDRIQKHIKTISDEMAAKKTQAETTNDLSLSEKLYEEAEKLRKKRNEQLEQVLLEILPEAFAVIKETARRLSENKALVVTATDWDRSIAAKKSNVIIDGDKATWKNTWIAAGGEIEWNMGPLRRAAHRRCGAPHWQDLRDGHR